MRVVTRRVIHVLWDTPSDGIQRPGRSTRDMKDEGGGRVGAVGADPVAWEELHVNAYNERN